MPWGAAAPQKSREATGQNSFPKGSTMAKGNNKRGNKEAKKPKQEKVKIAATANFNAGSSLNAVARKKAK